MTEASLTLYRRVLGERWTALPASLRAMHDLQESRTVVGRAEVERGRSLLSRMIGRTFGFPPDSKDTPVQVRFELKGGRQLWTRRFGTSTFVSEQWAGVGGFGEPLCERFGAFTFGLELVCDDGALYYVVKRAQIAGVPLPRAWMPASRTREFEQDGRFHFDVEISHPIAGLIIRYRGWLT